MLTEAPALKEGMKFPSKSLTTTLQSADKKSAKEFNIVDLLAEEDDFDFPTTQEELDQIEKEAVIENV